VTGPAAKSAGPARRRWRTVDGIVLLDKPAGLSSTQALQRVRRQLAAEKAGHAGTLDPMATGMLPLCFGQATKACGTLLGRRKAYRATIRLGVATDTADAEGRVIDERPVPDSPDAELETVLAALRGERTQVPPMYSALKQQGRPLYERARRGETVERAPRAISIDRLVAIGRDGADVEIEVVCSKGTYVRVLGEEIATGLGTVGHLVALRRLWVEPFETSRLVTFEEIEAAAGFDPSVPGAAPEWLLPVDRAFPDLPSLRFDSLRALHLRQGRMLDSPPDLPAGTTLVRAYDEQGRFLGLLEADPDGRLRVQRLFVAGAGTSAIDPPA
jgi:tRNA pseudouridine55 synthase